MSYIQNGTREQIRLESIESYVDEDSEIRVIDLIIDKMDTESLGFKVPNNETTGRPAFNPKDLLKLYVYGYSYGVRSSRKLAKQCIINREVIWLIKEIKPKYRVISDFRKDNIDAKEKKYGNTNACKECINRNKCTKSKSGKTISRYEHSDVVDEMVNRIENDKNKYSQRKSTVEHPFGTIKRSMNFTYLLLRNLEKIKGEISLAFFTYNLKRVINILGVKEILESLLLIIYIIKIELDYKFIN